MNTCLSPLFIYRMSEIDKRSALHISYEQFLNSLLFFFHPLGCFLCSFIANINAIFTEMIKHLEHNE